MGKSGIVEGDDIEDESAGAQCLHVDGECKPAAVKVEHLELVSPKMVR